MSDILHAVAQIQARADGYALAERYYDGAVPEVFASPTLRRLLAHTGDGYRLNYASTVVDAVLNRLELAAVMGTTNKANEVIQEIYADNELELESDEVHRRALMYGDCYVMAWPDDDGNWQVSYNSPRTTTIVYDPENPRTKLFAAKLWQTQMVNYGPGYVAQTDTEFPTWAPANKVKWSLNLYYEDRIEKYTSMSQTVGTSSDTIWSSAGVVDNPFGAIPVFHFRTHRPYGRPEHQAAFGPQDAINKLVATAMTTVDYQGAPQRYALSQQGSAEVTDFDENGDARENIAALRNGPGELWYLQGVTAVGQFDPADPDTFWKPIQSFVNSMASITDTPLHYFNANTKTTSGEALRTLEAPLIKKVGDRQLAFASAWRDLFRFILEAEGVNADVQVKWQAVESMDSLDAWDVALKKRAAGVPLQQVLIEMGYDPDLIKKLLAEIAAMQQSPAPQVVSPGPQPEPAPPATKTEKQHNQAMRQQANANTVGNENGGIAA